MLQRNGRSSWKKKGERDESDLFFYRGAARPTRRTPKRD
jgi:hypothetical protein